MCVFVCLIHDTRTELMHDYWKEMDPGIKQMEPGLDLEKNIYEWKCICLYILEKL